MDKKVYFTVLVAALGYFVDVYDLLVFSIVRVASLKELGIEGEALTDTGVFLLNTQLAGMLLGGVLWGIWGDKKGRLSILFGSILLYSAANIANAFVTDVFQYALCRFMAGLGLAGEIGAGITLVAELLPKEKRGIGTMIVATVGVAGGMTAALVGDTFHWQTAYITGGCMGMALLFLRLSVMESDIFRQQARTGCGDLRLLFTDLPRFLRYLRCILIGIPAWFIVGLIMAFSPEIGKNLNLGGEIKAAGSLLWFYGGLVLGDFASGFLSQALRSRKKALWIFTAGNALTIVLLLNLPAGTLPETFYRICAVTGFFSGCWAVFLTTTTESFGTNLRATVTTSVPNFVRGGAILLSSLFAAMKGSFGTVSSLEIIALGVFAAAGLALYFMQETFGSDLSFAEKGA